MPGMSKNLSFLDLINICDNARYGRPSPVPSVYDEEKLVAWHLNPSPTSPVLGLLRPAIVEQLHAENARSSGLSQKETWFFDLDGSKPRISFQDWVDGSSQRTEIMREMCERWRDAGLYEGVCGPKKWRGELYPIYKNPFGIRDHPQDGKDEDQLNLAFELERSACALFGLVTYGVHMSIFSHDADGGVRVWTPTRSRSKPTWPGYLDNSVAGGTPSGMGLFESMVKEAMEEASVPEEIVRKHARSVGVISYFFRTSQGWLQPEVEYVYDLVIPANADPKMLEPKPNDGEVEKFEFLSQDEIIRRMRDGLFKPNCALVLIDLFMRLGYINPENEGNYFEISTRLHGNFDYSKW